VEWCAVGVQNGWWDEFDVAGVDEDLPPGVVHVAVVGLAEQDAVVDAGVPAVGPVLRVVGLAESRGSVAAGEGASAVPGDQRPAQGQGECAGINRLGGGDGRALRRRSSEPRRPRVMRWRS
jgi:hypothetical protein